MPRGQAAADGATYVSANGYHYTKRKGKFKATHVLMMEDHLGRPLSESERVRFKNGDKTDLRIDNLRLTIKGKASLHTQLARLIARRDELDAQIKEVQEQIELKESRTELTKLEKERAS